MSFNQPAVPGIGLKVVDLNSQLLYDYDRVFTSHITEQFEWREVSVMSHITSTFEVIF